MHADEPFPSTSARVRQVALGALVALASPCASGASFDCQRARFPTEIAICRSPALSALDERMARTYRRALQALSPEGAALLKDSQRGWLRFATHACERRQPAAHAGTLAPVNGPCLEGEFTDRIGQLEQAGIRVGPYVFNRVDRYDGRFTRGGDATGKHAGVVTLHVAYPQIDAPRTPATDAWNDARRQALPTSDADPDDDTDEDVDYALGCVGEAFVSLSRTSAEYRHGAAHGTFDHEVHNARVAPALRAMTAADIFAPSSGWQDKLPALLWRLYVGKDDAIGDQPDLARSIRDAAADPGRWLLTPAGLQIAFDADEGGCHACNPGPLTVPWAALKSMLATPELAACKAPPPPGG